MSHNFWFDFRCGFRTVVRGGVVDVFPTLTVPHHPSPPRLKQPHDDPTPNQLLHHVQSVPQTPCRLLLMFPLHHRLHSTSKSALNHAVSNLTTAHLIRCSLVPSTYHNLPTATTHGQPTRQLVTLCSITTQEPVHISTTLLCLCLQLVRQDSAPQVVEVPSSSVHVWGFSDTELLYKHIQKILKKHSIARFRKACKHNNLKVCFWRTTRF